MTETPEQYIARILGTLGQNSPLEILEATPARLESLVRGRSAGELTRRPEPTRWSVAEILAHLADAEIVGAYRLRMMIVTPGVALQAYDQDRFAELLDYAHADAQESLRGFSAIRALNLRIWRSTDPVRLATFAMHSERGKETFERLRALYAGHDLNHLKQIEKILGA